MAENEKLKLHINTNEEEIKESNGNKNIKKVDTPQTPIIKAIEKWSYDESADIEILEASNGNTYTFRRENKNPRKIYFSMKIKRFSDIDNVRESFRCRYHLYLNWMITKKEYESYISYKKERKLKKKKMKWEPKFKPRIEFVNNVEEHIFESTEYPPDGCYRVLTFSNWLTSSECGFNCNSTLFIRQKLECDYTFSEQLELRSFPFDCQDFTVIIRESSGTTKAVLMPEPRYTNSSRKYKSDFFKLDPTFSVLDEWDFYSIFCEIADSQSGASRSKSVYTEITIRFKLKRRWKVYFYNIIFYFMIITFLSLTCFALDVEDIGERLNLAVTILLTLVAFQHTVFEKLPNIPYLTFMHKYIILSFIFVCVVILESSFVPITSNANSNDISQKHTGFAFDVTMSWLFGLFWILYNIFFILRSGWHRHIQAQKLLMDTDQIHQNVEEKYPQFLFTWKSLRDFVESGNYEIWQQQESILEVQRQESTRDGIKKRGRKKGKNKRLIPKKAHCVMEFGGKRGEILTFASYAQKGSEKDLTFCGFLSIGLSKCFTSCLICCCCQCCGDNKDTNYMIEKKKSQAYEQSQTLKVK